VISEKIGAKEGIDKVKLDFIE